MISVLSSAERTVGAALSPLADDLGSTYIGLVFMSGLCLAPMVMFGLGILCAGPAAGAGASVRWSPSRSSCSMRCR